MIARLARFALLAFAASAFLHAAPQSCSSVVEQTDTLRFAIICDRTGGMRPGVFEKAVEKINSLEPEFVMCVGDLIDGYTESPAVWTKQWDELDSIIKNLKAPFYAVVGNHDISNPKMREAWTKRRGAAHYAFVKKNVLFLVLDSEDIKDGGMSAEQVAFARKALADNPGVRWTFLFFHRPLWLEKNQNGYEQIAQALRGRSYTVFTGHLHHYISGKRHGMNHYVLATSGGDSALRGECVGEFDHVTTVSLVPGHAPEVTNHEIEGNRTISPDILTEQYEGRAAALRDGTWLHIAPVIKQTEFISQLEIPLTLRNPEPSVLRVTGTLAPQAGLHFEPSIFDATVQPGETKTAPVIAVTSGSALDIHALNEAGVAITLTAAYDMQNGHAALPASRSVLIDWIHAIKRSSAPINFDSFRDGKLDPAVWPPALFTNITRPMFIKESWDWHGPADGTFSFAVQQYEGALYVAVVTTDDKLITNPDPAVLQDKIIVTIQTLAGKNTYEAVAGTRAKNIIAQPRPRGEGLVAQFVIPLPKNEKIFGLNIGWVDVDNRENTKPSVLWWRPVAATELGRFSTGQ